VRLAPATPVPLLQEKNGPTGREACANVSKIEASVGTAVERHWYRSCSPRTGAQGAFGDRRDLMKLRLACILGILAVAFGGAALAQVQPAPATPGVAGTVVSSSATSFVIRTDAGTEQRFDVDTT